MGVSTRRTNADQHPGRVAMPTQSRRSRKEVEAERNAAKEAKAVQERDRKKKINTIAAIETKIQQGDKEVKAVAKVLPHQRHRTSAKDVEEDVVDSDAGQESDVCSTHVDSVLTESQSSGESFHLDEGMDQDESDKGDERELEEESPKKKKQDGKGKKGKSRVREEIMAVQEHQDIANDSASDVDDNLSNLVPRHISTKTTGDGNSKGNKGSTKNSGYHY